MSTERPKIAVVGDAMEDMYWCGSAARLSPEAPIPVVKLPDDGSGIIVRPGGAANVAACLKALGAQVTELYGPQRPRKHRLMVGDTQIARWDEHDWTEPIKPVHFEQVFACRTFDVTIVSDYQKGAMDCIRKDSFTGWRGQLFVDTKCDPAPWFPYADMMFPNDTEYRELEDAFNKYKGLTLHKKGAKGLELKRRRFEVCQPSSAKARFVRSVNGAGDAVIAAAAYWVATNKKCAPGYEMLRFCNAAAAVVCEKPYTATATREEIQEVLDRR